MDGLENKDTKNRSLNKKQKASLLVSFVTLLAITFCASYYITNYITNPNNKSKDVEAENETVYSENNYLSDNTFVSLNTNDNVDMIDTLLKLKEKLGFKDKLTLEELSSELLKKGYELYEKSEDKLVYTRTEESSENTLEANKYYLGEENGYISIFKTDDSGNIIESEKKVYSDSKPLSNLPETDQNYIKENKFSFDNKDDALQKLSEMIS
ncbi:hypothetical protein [Clostridium tertium]|uniref:Bypass of forespore C C-terminal domain-containing protein n=1 Tax=Clostridium tertium TaxID=1559 RepID=A0A6N3F4B5_9CLOT